MRSSRRMVDSNLDLAAITARCAQQVSPPLGDWAGRGISAEFLRMSNRASEYRWSP